MPTAGKVDRQNSFQMILMLGIDLLHSKACTIAVNYGPSPKSSPKQRISCAVKEEAGSDTSSTVIFLDNQGRVYSMILPINIPGRFVAKQTTTLTEGCAS